MHMHKYMRMQKYMHIHKFLPIKASIYTYYHSASINQINAIKRRINTMFNHCQKRIIKKHIALKVVEQKPIETSIVSSLSTYGGDSKTLMIDCVNKFDIVFT